MDQRYWIQNLTGAITLIFPGPKVKSTAGLIKISSPSILENVVTH